ncbi:hypothetical protein CO612_01090 [Lysobacteraceae bacterium NML71-0210]|nr:hypothetical protein CO612_01090 [Xanthomonadaceae bacterium NML71-0210]
MKPLSLLLSLGISLPMFPALAQPPALPRCNPNGNQLEMNACARDEFRTADAELNRIYREIRQRYSNQPLKLERLRDAQRLWIQLRDADLAAQFPVAHGEDPRVEYGSMYPLEYAGAKAAITRARSQWLRDTFLDTP